MATEPTIEEVAAAKARLNEMAPPPPADPNGIWHAQSQVWTLDVRTLLASLASLEERVQELETLTSEMTLAMFLDCGGDMPTDEPAP